VKILYLVDGFKTGDIGKINPDKTIAIIDRKKNLIKPPHGEYIAPERLESVYKNSNLVDNIMVHVSTEHDELLALVYPNKQALTAWAHSNGVSSDDFKTLCANSKCEAAVLQSLASVHKQNNLKSLERISAVKLFHEEWTPENGWLTAAMKLRRNEIQKIHKDELEEMYKQLGSS